ncbi:MAG: Rieske 2Fe-2S domain-containing protein [Bacteroidia bacterium]
MSRNMSVAQRILGLHPYPRSWYVVAVSSSLKSGEIREVEFCGQRLVLYRTVGGRALLTEAYCPHMGAHFAHGGTVVGEDLKCPFHGFCFDPEGKCAQTGYGTKVPPQARLQVFPTIERNGLIMAWNGEIGSTPDFEIPEWNWDGWTPTRFKEWELTSHPQEVAENSVDIGHFRHVHGYDEVKEIEDIRTDGPRLYGKYGMARMTNFIGKWGKKVEIEFTIHQHGLGFALVEAYVVNYGMHSRHFVLSSPIDGKVMFLRIGVSVRLDFKPRNIHPLLGLLPTALIRKLVVNGYYHGYCKDVSDDFKVWNNKVYIHPPYLAQGDGPVVLYRKWAAQFY